MAARARKSYGGKSSKDNGGKPFEFDINGEVFITRPGMPATTLLAFADLAGVEAMDAENLDLSKIHEMIDLLNDTFRSVFSKADYQRFRDAIDDPNNNIGIEELMEIFGDLAAHFTTDMAGRARPTGKPSSDGSDSPSPGAASRTGRQPSTTTYNRAERRRKVSSR